ncbi:IS91 family transposase [Stieleria varia]|nr:transposase [Stieleria varia]
MKLFCDRYRCMPGLVQVIHTWGQRLNHHFHVHTVLTGGGLSVNEKGKVDASSTQWVDVDLDDAETRTEELAADFKTLFLKGLRGQWEKGELRLPINLADESALQSVLAIVQNKDWIADIQGTPPEYRGQSENQHVFGYLAKYVAGVAIGDGRLIRVNDDEVVFDAKDYRDQSRVEVSMPPKEFCYAFSRHILPHGMPRTRYAGCFAPNVRKKYLELCRTLWKQSHPEFEDPLEADSQSPLEESTTKEPHDYRCKKCNGLVDPSGQLEGSLTVSLLAVAYWVVTWQQTQAASTQVVPHWRRALAAVIGQRISMPSKNAFINGMRSGLIQPDAHWLSLIEQAIELVSEEVEWPEASARPP